tara:strand:+ start:821 stop:1675 length:855 start_codon:yes stop_codon:yes gene_type:complete
LNPYNVLVLGSTGMLGSEVSKAFAFDKSFNLFATHRNSGLSTWSIFSDKPDNVKFIKYDCLLDSLDSLKAHIENIDYIINCIGSIKIGKDDYNSIYLNSIFPHKLSEWAVINNYKTINISSDGVFSGLRKTGSYTEADTCDDLSLYGKSKSMGECSDSMILRTSVFAEDKFSNKGLISWLKNNKGKTVDGYTNYLWNGMSGLEYGKLCKKIILNNLYEKEIFHIFSPTSVSKFELLSLINDKYSLDIKIRPVKLDVAINRTLSTCKSLNSKLNVAEITNQLKVN